MGRNILFITTDQQRYDALGCNGGAIARTPVADRLAASGINYRRAHNQNVVCMPARSTMITGQYVRTHGVFANGVPLPADAPSVAAYLHEKAGYRTALLGKAHFEPAFDLRGDGSRTRWREGVDRTVSRLRAHGARDARADRRMALLGVAQRNYPDEIAGFAPMLSARAAANRRARSEVQSRSRASIITPTGSRIAPLHFSTRSTRARIGSCG